MMPHVDVSQDKLQPEVIRDTKADSKLSGEQLIKLLDFIPADCDRDSWWQVGAALKKELGDERGFEAWVNWSKKAPDKYDQKVAYQQWSSFDDKGITGGTIYHFAKEHGFRGFDVEAADAPEIKENWVYVLKIKRFVETARLSEYDKEQFDARFAPSFKGRPSDHVLKNPTFKRPDAPTYWPNQDIYVNEDGTMKLNYWRPSGVTPALGDVKPFLDHVKYLYPDPDEAKILLSYLAFQVQHPGEKVHWAVLLEGDQGNGKSYFAEVMRLVLGPHNVRMVQTEHLHETFTGWQRNTQLIVVEEMMARARLETMNKLKPMITESWCSIREMYRPPYEQPNRFNFLFFSNHQDSILIDNTDRRYCILKTKAKPHPGGNYGYYAPLFNWTKANAPALLHYLSQYDLAGFQPKAHAPMTDGKRQLILQSMLPLDQFIYQRVETAEGAFSWDVLDPQLLVPVLSRSTCGRIQRTFVMPSSA